MRCVYISIFTRQVISYTNTHLNRVRGNDVHKITIFYFHSEINKTFYVIVRLNILIDKHHNGKAESTCYNKLSKSGNL